MRGVVAGAASCVLLALYSVAPLTVAPAAADPPVVIRPASAPTATATTSSIDVGGHGWGHGRGMGQYGALGYALDHGWSSAQILDQFYGGTQSSTVGAGAQMSVRLLANDAQSVRIQVDNASIATIADSGPAVGSSGKAVQIALQGPNSFVISDAPSCAGPWTQRPGAVTSTQLRVVPARVTDTTFGYGFAADLPSIGDWNGDGIATAGVYRGGNWYLRNANSNGPVDAAFGFGLSGDVPVVGDWNGDGIDTVGVFRNGDWYLRNSNSNGPPDAVFGFGLSGDIPVVGDWNGNGVDTVGVFRNGTFYLRNSNSNGPPDAVFGFGFAGDTPIAGDWNNDGFDSIGVRRGSTFYLRNANSNGPVDFAFDYGPPSAVPVTGHWRTGAGDLVGYRDNSVFKLSDGTPPTTGVQLLSGSDNALDQTLQVCGAGTDTRWYRGELRAVSDQGVQRLVNVLDLDAYVRGVVPRESPASWGNLGCDTNPCRGMAALEAQAVAARSYSMAENRYAYAKTCDTTVCQVYGGRRVRSGGTETDLESPFSDKAVANTALVVRVGASGVARTEFSSSTGGFTAGGVFPAVPDDGDDVSLNPNHNWSTALATSTIESRYGMGSLQQIAITSRTPEDGGRRVQNVHLVFSNGTLDRTGASFQSDFGLKSTWFALGSAALGPQTVGVFRGGNWYLRNSNTNGPPDATFGFGLPGDIPVVGDWNGDGVDTVGVFRSGNFYLRNSNTNGPPDIVFGFGLSGDRPTVGDWNGDGIDTPGVFRDGNWYLRNSNSNGPPDAAFGFGLSGDWPAAADWNGDGFDSVGVFRGGNWYLRNSNSNGPPDATFGFGLTNDSPVGGRWK